MINARSLVKFAATAVGVLLLAVPVKAKAAEVISHPVYGDAMILDSNGDGCNEVLFTVDNEQTRQLGREAASDPYFIRFNAMDAVLAKIKTGAVSSVVFDDSGNVTAVKDAAVLGQEAAAHLAFVAALDALPVEQQIALENQQLLVYQQQALQAEALRQQAAAALAQAAASGSPTDAALAQAQQDMSVQLLTLLAAKQQTVLLYQQQAEPAVIEQSLLLVQNSAACVQQALDNYTALLQNALMQAFAGR